MDEQALIDGIIERMRARFAARSRRDVPVAIARSPESVAAGLDIALGEEGLDAQSLLEAIDAYLDASVKTAHPHFMQALWGGLSAAGLAAEITTALSNTSSYTWELAPAATMIERELIVALAERIGWSEADGTFTTGGSAANLLGLLLARDRARGGERTSGIDGRSLAIHVSAEAHYSVPAAAHVMGIGEGGVFKVACDNHGRMAAAALEASLARARDRQRASFCVVATSGTTVRAAFDPVDALADVCEREELWLHVDAALGGIAMFSDKTSHLLEGLARADSVTFDAHKLMGAPLTCSTLLTRHRGVLEQSCSHAKSADYLFNPAHEQYDLGRKSLQCGRRVDALKLWLSWKAEGHAGWRRRVERFVELAAYLEAAISAHPELELMSSRSFTNVCFRYRGGLDDGEGLDLLNARMRQRLADGGRYMVSLATVGGKAVLRPAIANPAIDRRSLDGFVADAVAVARELAPTVRTASP